jgi:hypothetical protein
LDQEGRDVSAQAVAEQPQSATGGGKRVTERLLMIHGERITDKSYVARAATALPEMEATFTIPQLARRAGIPRSKGYPAARRLLEMGLLEAVPRVARPRDWPDYSRGMRRRFYEEYGLPRRGLEPQRYRYTPVRALARAREALMCRVDEVDREAGERAGLLLREYMALEEELLAGG